MAEQIQLAEMYSQMTMREEIHLGRELRKRWKLEKKRLHQSFKDKQRPGERYPDNTVRKLLTVLDYHERRVRYSSKSYRRSCPNFKLTCDQIYRDAAVSKPTSKLTSFRIRLGVRKPPTLTSTVTAQPISGTNTREELLNDRHEPTCQWIKSCDDYVPLARKITEDVKADDVPREAGPRFPARARTTTFPASIKSRPRNRIERTRFTIRLSRGSKSQTPARTQI